MRSLLLYFFLFCSLTSQGHPSWGLAVNTKGEIYFVDVMHNDGTLWKINTEGELIAILTNFHAHDLHMDDENNLWLAENLWIEGEIEGEGRHTLIKIEPNQKIDTLIVTEDIDVFNGTNIAIGPNQEIFFIQNNQLYEYSNGKARLAARHKFENVKNILMDNDGILWIADSKFKNGSLYRFGRRGQLTLFTTDIMPADPRYPLFKEPHLQFMIGIAKDGQDNIYISENAGCRIIKINSLGEHSVFYQSSIFWSPMNVAFHKGEAYILEAGFNKRNTGPRLIKKDSDGAISRIANVDTAEVSTVGEVEDKDGLAIPTWVYFGLGLLIFGLAIILSVRKEYKSN